MDRKFIMLGSGVIVILLIAIFAVTALSNKQISGTSQSSEIQTPSRSGKVFSGGRRRSPVQGEGGTYVKRGVVTPVFGRDAAEAVIEWLNTQRIFGVRLENPSQYGEFVVDGGYSTGTFCDENKKCTKNIVANNLGLIATWANYQYYKYVDRNEDVMKVIDKDLRTYVDTKKISAIQPVTTNFKQMYELWSEGEFSAEQKDRIKNIMYRIQHDPSIVDPIEAEIKAGGRVPEPVAISAVKPYESIQDFGVDSQADMYAVISSEYAYTYLYVRDTGDDVDDTKYLYTAIGLYNKATTLHNNPYYLGIAALDLHKATANAFYLRQAEVVAQQTISYPCGKLDSCAVRIYFLHELAKATGNQEYTKKRNELLTPVITNSYDSEGLTGYRFGYNAFYNDDPALNERYRYALDTNALLVRVLVEL